MASTPDQSSRDRSVSLNSGLPKHEHKRPRLDTNRETERADLDRAALVRADDSIELIHERPQTPPQPCTTSVVLSPTNKMTINTRPLSAQSALPSDNSPSGALHGRSMESITNGKLESDQRPESQTAMESVMGGPDEPISIPSSPAESVIIHISAPEEIEASSSVTTWSSISGPTTDGVRVQTIMPLWSTFPHLHGSSKQETSSTVDGLIKSLEIPADGLSHIRELTAWFERSAEQLDFNRGSTMLQDVEILKHTPRLLLCLHSVSRTPRHSMYADLMPELLDKYTVFALAVVRSSLDVLEKQTDLVESCPDLVYLVTGYIRPLVSALQAGPGRSTRFPQDLVSDDSTQLIFHRYGSVLFSQISQCTSRVHRLLPLSSPLRLHIMSLVQDFSHLLHEKLVKRVVLDDDSEVLIRSIVTDFLITSRDILRLAITKQQTWLNLGNIEQYIEQYQDLVRKSFKVSEETKKQILHEARLDNHIDESFDSEIILLVIYKFLVLKVLLQHGRMELRVAAMTIMSTDLVQIYKDAEKLGQHRPMHSTMLEMMAHFLKNNTIVKYTLGLDSHPQIVERSHNTIGFLCITGYWDTSDTDVVWQVILSSQDPHMIPAIFQALSANVQHMKISALDHICRNVHSLISGRFDDQTLGFVVLVLDKMVAKLAGHQGDLHDVCMNILKVCKHLLVEAFSPAHYSSEIASMVKQNVTDILVEWKIAGNGSLLASLSGDEQARLAQDFQTEIAAHGPQATGITLILSMLLSILQNGTAEELILQHDFAKLLVDDIVHATKHFVQVDAASLSVLNAQCEIRLYCFQTIVVRVPSSVSQSLCQTIWTDLIVNNEISLVRDRLWLTLAEMCEAVRTTNPLLLYISDQLLTQLPSSMLDRYCLEYAQNSVWLDRYCGSQMLPTTEEKTHLPHMAHLWRIVLESPWQSVAKAASEFMVRVFVEGSIFVNRLQGIVDLGRAAFVEKCVSIIRSCAQHTRSTELEHRNGDHQGSMEQETLHGPQNRQRALRCLDMLRSFVVNWRLSRSTAKSKFIQLERASRIFRPRGTPHQVNVSVSGHAVFTDEKPWMIGLENTVAELYEFLAQLTGWTDMNVTVDGHSLHIKDNDLAIRDLGSTATSISVERTPGASENDATNGLHESFDADTVMLGHLESLCELLDHEELVASATYEFLASFPHQESLVDRIRHCALSSEELLPLSRPYKLLYNAMALRTMVLESLSHQRPDEQVMRYTVDHLVTLTQGLRVTKLPPALFLRVVATALDVWLPILQAELDVDTSRRCFEGHDHMVTDLLHVWQRACDFVDALKFESGTFALQRGLFECVISILLYEERLWPKGLEADTFSALIARTLITDESRESRHDIVTVICGVANLASRSVHSEMSDSGPVQGRIIPTKLHDCMHKLWRIIYALLPQAVAQPCKSHEYFEASSVLLNTILEQLEISEVQQILKECQSLLSRDEDERLSKAHSVLLGTTRLVYSCAKRIYSSGGSVLDSQELIKTLFHRYLFPALPDEYSGELENQSTLVLDFDTRAQMYDLSLLMCRSLDDFRLLIEQLDQVTISEGAFRLTASNDRRCIRSEKGYTGLYNLSNTCYLNSLFSQLFMNIKFRQCVLDARIIDGNKQKLVRELAEVFALMQGSVEKAASPERVVDSIVQYDGEQIDVSVQMDVDEFFNLLFDRLESQMVDEADRKCLKSIFGGQLVQQIKSKQCEHVSERIEPFNALQIEIKGKKGLEEGLAAYVEGEVLQGENKYSCSGCGKLVEAVKRACLKDIPDHLILNLKRFDYDIMTGQRCKVNDEFSFPEKVDMRPYSLAAFSEPDERLNTDMFELVGVIIHAGTAEMGHYYSFTRERPSLRPAHDTWIQFNDSDVTKFDFSQMREQAFGGLSTDGPYSVFPKHYNGYMLFYQRSNGIQEYASGLTSTRSEHAATNDLPGELSQKIVRRNEEYLRQYVLQDLGHAKFMRVMLGQLDQISEGCTESHTLEDDMIQLVLGYVSRVSSRSKDTPEVENTVQILLSRARRCQDCAMCIVRWFNTNEHMANAIMKSFYPTARKVFACTLSVSLGKLLEHCFPRGTSDRDNEDYPDDVRLSVDLCVRKLKKSWSLLQKFPRAWDPYFQVLQSVAQLGLHEARMLVEGDFLERCLEIIWVHHDPMRILKKVRAMYEDYLAARSTRHKMFNYGGAMDLFALLLPTVELGKRRTDWPIGQVPPSDNEKVYLQLSSHADRWTWLIKLVSGGASENASAEVVKELCQYAEHGRVVQYSLRIGLVEARTISQAAGYIKPLLTFMEHNDNQELVTSLLDQALAHIEQLDSNLLSDFLDFIKEVCRLPSLACGLSQRDLIAVVRDNIRSWLPPLAMAPNEMHRDVRNEAVALADMVFFGPVQDESDRAEVLRELRDLSSSIIKFLQDNYISGDPRTHQTLETGQSAQILRVMERCVALLESVGAGEASIGIMISNVRLASDELALAQEAALEVEDMAWEDSEVMSEAESIEGSVN